MRKFKNVFLSNLLVVLALVPMIILLGAAIEYTSNVIFWGAIGVMSLIGISYMQYRDEKDADK